MVKSCLVVRAEMADTPIGTGSITGMRQITCHSRLKPLGRGGPGGPGAAPIRRSTMLFMNSTIRSRRKLRPRPTGLSR